MKTLTRTDIRHECGETYYNRGLGYYNRGRVVELIVKDETELTTHITGRVSGSSGNIYHQEIQLSDHNQQISIKGLCSCPMYYNCKHVAAVCLSFVENATQQGAPEERLLQWLDDLQQSAGNKTVQKTIGNRDFLCFSLKKGAQPDKIEVEFKLLRWLKSGKLGKPRGERELIGQFFTTTPSEAIGLWKTFIEDALPLLKQDGWQIDIDDPFCIEFHEPEQWWGELEEQDSGWFFMSLEVEIAGRRTPLLPLLGPILEAYSPDELPETVHVPLGEHRQAVEKTFHCLCQQPDRTHKKWLRYYRTPATKPLLS